MNIVPIPVVDELNTELACLTDLTNVMWYSISERKHDPMVNSLYYLWMRLEAFRKNLEILTNLPTGGSRK